MSRQKDKVTFVKLITINVIVIKIFDFLEFSVRKIKGSEIEGNVELRMSLYHKEPHFLKYVSQVNLKEKKKQRCKH